MLDKIRIEKRLIGSGEPVYIIAEIGSNHQGSIDTAKNLIRFSKNAGADAVKFQLFRAHLLTTPSHPAQTLLKKCELPYEWIPELYDFCTKNGIHFLCTPFHEEAVDLLEKTNAPAYKVASGDITHIPLIRYIANKKKPIILSTGGATMDEISLAIAAIGETGNNELILLQCVLDYPAELETANLRGMLTLAKEFKTPVGYSDHSLGDTVAIGAVALGACVIEKHVTLDRNSDGPDHKHSMEINDFKEMVKRIRNLETALGTGQKVPVAAEMARRTRARRNIYASSDIKAGSTIDSRTISLLRPEQDAKASLYDSFLGKKIRRNIEKMQQIKHEDLI